MWSWTLFHRFWLNNWLSFSDLFSFQLNCIVFSFFYSLFTGLTFIYFDVFFEKASVKYFTISDKQVVFTKLINNFQTVKYLQCFNFISIKSYWLRMICNKIIELIQNNSKTIRYASQSRFVMQQFYWQMISMDLWHDFYEDVMILISGPSAISYKCGFAN